MAGWDIVEWAELYPHGVVSCTRQGGGAGGGGGGDLVGVRCAAPHPCVYDGRLLECSASTIVR